MENSLHWQHQRNTSGDVIASLHPKLFTMSQPEFLHLFSLLSVYSYSFLEIKDIVALDSACVNGENRKRYLESLNRISLPQMRCSTLSIQWFLRRNVLPASITVGKFMSETDAILLSEVASAVQEIHVVDLRELWHRSYLSCITCLKMLIPFCSQLQRIIWHPDEDAYLGTITFHLMARYLSLASKLFPLLADSCPALTHMEIHDKKLTLDTFRSMLYKCRHISTLDVRDCTQLMAGRALLEVTDLCPQLEALTLNYTNRLEDSVLTRVATKCAKLRCLRILETGRRFDADEVGEGFPCVPSSGFSHFTRDRPPLETLHLSSAQVAYEDFMSLFARFAGIKNVVLSCVNCVGGPGSGWSKSIFAQCPLLATVELSLFSSVSTGTVGALAQYCTNIKAIDLKSIRNLEQEAIVIIAEQCSTELQSLELSMDVQVGPETLTSIARHYPHLTKLRIGLSNPTDASFQELATHCTNLVHLRFTAFSPFDFGLSAPQMCRLQHLEVHYMRGNCDASVLACVTHCTQLQSLRVSQLGRCKDKRIVRAIKRNCPRLNNCALRNWTGAVMKALMALQIKRLQNKVHFSYFAYDLYGCC